MMEWKIKSVEKVEKANNFNKDLSTFHTRKSFFKQLFETKKRIGLTINFFGQACIKANLSDKQSNNPHDYFQKG